MKHTMPKSGSIVLFLLVLMLLHTACNNKATTQEALSLDPVKSISALNDTTFFGGIWAMELANNRLYLADNTPQVFLLSTRLKLLGHIQKKGKGPGEVLRLDNFFITQKYLYTVDGAQRLINKYSLQSGHYLSSLNYGKLLLKIKSKSKTGAPSPPQPLYMDNNNQPFVTRDGTILLPTQTGRKFLYEAVNWKGKKLADISTAPKGYKRVTSDDKYWSTLEHKEIPLQGLAEAFPVNDCQDYGNIYVIYPAVPKIAKYTLLGKKLWEHKIPRMPEIHLIITDLSIRAKMIKNYPKGRVAHIPVRTYVAGRCSPGGDLYLTTFTEPTMPDKYRRPMWIHRFSPEGELIKRYKIGTNVGVSFFPAIDFKRHRIFISFFRDTGIKIYDF